MTAMKFTYQSQSKSQRGVVMFILLAAILGIVAFAGLAVDRSFDTYRRVQAQDAADMAAKAAGWTLVGYGTLSPTPAQVTAAKLAATNMATYNGYTNGGNTTVTVTYPYVDSTGTSYYNEIQVLVSRVEPTFFSRVVGFSNALIQARATDAFTGIQKTQQSAGGYGKLTTDFNYASYGPQNGTDRGDKINTGFVTMGGAANPWFGTNSNSSSYNGPADYPYGSVFEFDVPTSYETQYNSGSTTDIDFEIFDPETYAKSGTDALGNFDEMDHAPSGSNSNKEDWLYTLWKGGAPGTANAVIVAQAVYGEQLTSGGPGNGNDQPNTNDHWVTPPGFDYNAYSDMTGPNNGTLTYYVSVQTTDDVKQSNGWYSTGNPAHYGTGYDENGYLLRAGPDHATDNSNSINQGTSQTLTIKTKNGGTYNATSNPYRTDLMDPAATVPGVSPSTTYNNYWNTHYGTASGITMYTDTPLSINCNDAATSATAVIYFGWAPANANPNNKTTITFFGWDEDSGATSLYYSYTDTAGVVHGTSTGPYTATLGNDGIWDGPAKNGNSYTLPTTYTGGYWTGYYTSGTGDNTTWYWTDSSGGQVSGYEYLTNTGNNVY